MTLLQFTDPHTQILGKIFKAYSRPCYQLYMKTNQNEIHTTRHIQTFNLILKFLYDFLTRFCTQVTMYRSEIDREYFEQWTYLNTSNSYDCKFTDALTNQTTMWANAQRDGRPAEYRWRLHSTPQSLADAHY